MMILEARFREGMRAAVPIWIAFVPSSIAWGIAAQAHGLTLQEILLMSALVYSGPAQFAVLAPLAEGKSALGSGGGTAALRLVDIKEGAVLAILAGKVK